MLKKKTPSELMFENYLKQRRIPFDYEPYGVSGRNPDYRFLKAGYKVLVEVKGIESLPIDAGTRQLTPGRVHTFSLDPRKTYNQIRRRIEDASKQLKGKKDDADCCAIIIGKHAGWNIGRDDLVYAMIGDPVFSIPINPS